MTKWVDRTNDLLIVVSALLIVSYIVFNMLADTVGQELGLKMSGLGLVLAIISLAFSAVGYRFVRGRVPQIAAWTVIGLFTLTSGFNVASTGGLESSYVILWAATIFSLAAFGPLVLGALWLSTAMYFSLNQLGLGAIDHPNEWLVNFILLQIPVIAGAIFWHKVESQTQQGTLAFLSNSLEDEKRKADIVIQAIADGVIVVGSEGQIKLINPAAQDLLGWTWEDALDLDYRVVMKLTDDHDTPIPKGGDPFLKVQQNREAVTNNELILHTKSNKKLDISLVVSPIKNPDGSVGATIGVFRDVSAEKQQQKQRADFISTASHEMRTPVAAIEGYLALAMNDKVAKIDTKAREYLGKAIDSTRHLGKLFQDLLTSAKAEDGRLTSHPKVTDIGEMVEQLVDDLRFTAEKKNLLVDYDNSNKGSANVRPIYYSYVDPERMREVITNIFDNAVKYTEEGKIIIGLTGTEDRLTITVSDTGAGIPQEDIPHLFQKFYRVDSSATRQVGGTGLGLFITRKIIELYGGRIWVESVVDQGSNFFISLPRMTNQEAQRKIQEEANQVTPLSEIGSQDPNAAP